MSTQKSVRVLIWVAMCGLLVIPACGGGDSSSNPSAPTVSAPTINGSTDMVYIGQSVTFSAVGTNVKWGGDAPSVAPELAASRTGYGTALTGQVTPLQELSVRRADCVSG